MKLPSDDTIRLDIDRLRRHARKRKPDDRDRLPTLDDIEHLMLAFWKRDRTGIPEADGYPSSVAGLGRGGAELTSVEAAAQRRIGLDEEGALLTSHDADRFHDDCEKAWALLSDSVSALGALGNLLEDMQRRSSPLSRAEAGGAGSCLACGGDVSGAAEDRLKRGLGPCCYTAWARAGRPELTEFIRVRKEAS